MYLEKVIIAKSNIILDVKPWDDETDMKELERLTRTVETDGLLWGACKISAVFMFSWLLSSETIYLLHNSENLFSVPAAFKTKLSV